MGCVCRDDVHDEDCGYGPPRMELKRAATNADRDAAEKVMAASPADHRAADRLLGRWQAPWRVPSEERDPINVHPIVITELRALLMNDPELKGVGYSEFIMRAIRQWQMDHA